VIKERATGQRMMLYLNSTKENGEKHDRDFRAVIKSVLSSLFYFMIKLLLKSTDRIAH
jgi:hypothetical protein